MVRRSLLPWPFMLLVSAIVCRCRESDTVMFTQMTSSTTGINFKNTIREDESANVLNYLYFYNGGGVAAGDINNDGLPDLLFTGNMVPNRLYLNKGNFEFEDITELSGISDLQGWCTGASMVDINNDGLLDIYICRSGDIIPERRRNLLYINQGDMKFIEKGMEYGLADEGYSTQASFFDYDLDGDLDMFLINHSLQQYAYDVFENTSLQNQKNEAFSSKLFRNDGGRFVNVTKEAGITSNVLSFGLGLSVADVNNDNWPDIYVSNDFNEHDYLFINNRDGTFAEKTSECLDQVSLFSMGTDMADYDNDGLVDIVTLDMLSEDNYLQKMHSGAENFDKFQMLFQHGFYYQYSRNMLHRNNGDGTFSEIGQLMGISNTDWSWSALFCDFDNDGRKDLFVTNGYPKDYTDMDFMKYQVSQVSRERQGGTAQTVQELLREMPSLELSNYLFKNNVGGFVNVAQEWGLSEKSLGSGAAYVDLDGDGDLDLVINNTNNKASIYRNNSERINPDNSFIKIRFRGGSRNINGIGVRVNLYCGDEIFTYENFPVRGFQSAMEPYINAGVGRHKVIDSIHVTWPGGMVQKLQQIRVGQSVTISQAEAGASFDKVDSVLAAGLFSSSGKQLFRHIENRFNDFSVQPLLPHYLSRLGPCIARGDINGDGLEDVFIGGASRQHAAVFIQNSSGDFNELRQPGIRADSAFEDVAALFFDADGDGDLDLYVGSGGYEIQDSLLLHDRLYLNDGSGKFTRYAESLPVMPMGTGCVKAADINADGHLDLFIGGRVIPGSYPISPRSYILLNNGKGQFSDATSQIAPGLLHPGMVTDAAFTDINSDGLPDLLVVGEWMPLKIFINQENKLIDKSSDYIKFPTKGWWNTLAIADFDNDGDVDIIIGNLGLNSQLKASESHPLTLFYKDFDRNGSIDPLLSYYVGGRSYPAVSLDDLTDQLPLLKKQYLTYRSFAKVEMTELLAAAGNDGVDSLQTLLLETTYLENRGAEGFVRRDLPVEIQYAPVYSILVADVNHDGNDDLIVSGNNSWTRIRFGRYNASHAMVFLGDDQGSFRYLPQHQSGLRVRGDVRSAAVIQTPRDRVVLFGVNDNAAELYRLK